MKKLCGTIFIGIVISSNSMAGQAETEQIRSQYHLPALAAELITGNTTYSYIAGVRKWGEATPVQITDKFHLGSCTKAMTATILAVFIERGFLRWNSTLEEIFPEVASDMDPAFRKVSIEMLGAHRSGITGDMIGFNEGKLWEKLWDKELSPVAGRRMVVRELLANPPAAPPGSKYEYSNGNYIIIGAALEKLSGKSWETIISRELFKPLQMKSCGFGAQADPNAGLPDQPWPHRYSGSGPVPVTPDFFADNPPALGPAGAVHCSIKDWAKFAKLHLDGLNGNPTGILKAESFKKLHESYPGQEYTYGGWVRTTRILTGGPALVHAGSNTMNFADIWIAPKKNAIAISATNMGGDEAGKAVNDAIIALFKDMQR